MISKESPIHEQENFGETSSTMEKVLVSNASSQWPNAEANLFSGREVLTSRSVYYSGSVDDDNTYYELPPGVSEDCLEDTVKFLDIWPRFTDLDSDVVESISTSLSLFPNMESEDFTHQWISVEDACEFRGGKTVYVTTTYAKECSMFAYTYGVHQRNQRKCFGKKCTLQETQLLMDYIIQLGNKKGDDNNALPSSCKITSHVSNSLDKSKMYAGDPSTLPVSKQCAQDFGIIEKVPGPYPHLDGTVKGTSCQINPTAHLVSCDLSDQFLSVTEDCLNQGGGNTHLLDFYMSKDCTLQSSSGGDVDGNGNEYGITYTNSRQCAPKSCTLDEVLTIFDSFSWIKAMGLSAPYTCEIVVTPSSFPSESSGNTRADSSSALLWILFFVALIVGILIGVHKRRNGMVYHWGGRKGDIVSMNEMAELELKHIAVTAEVIGEII